MYSDYLALQSALREALDGWEGDAGDCDHLHHRPTEYHTSSQECPAEGRIQARIAELRELPS